MAESDGVAMELAFTSAANTDPLAGSLMETEAEMAPAVTLPTCRPAAVMLPLATAEVV